MSSDNMTKHNKSFHYKYFYASFYALILLVLWQSILNYQKDEDENSLGLLVVTSLVTVLIFVVGFYSYSKQYGWIS